MLRAPRARPMEFVQNGVPALAESRSSRMLAPVVANSALPAPWNVLATAPWRSTDVMMAVRPRIHILKPLWRSGIRSVRTISWSQLSARVATSPSHLMWSSAV